MDSKATTGWRVIRFDGGGSVEKDDEIATEMPLTVRLDGEEFATIVCTPGDLEDMMVGFLASEGVIRTIDDLKSLTLDEARGFAYAELHIKQSTGKEFHSKRFIGSCCGKSRQFYFHNDARTAKTIMSRHPIAAGQCLELMRLLQESSTDFHQTGGVHNAAICTADAMIAVRTDIGRHNALDKLYGHLLRSRIPAGDKIIAFSGRISSEVVLKVAKIGCGVLLSKSAPTDLALQLAEDLGITCAGFIRRGSMNVYTHPERIRS
ncbi:formate dehydrogenase accessory sulfurtransferase FdhD [Paenibacillus nasutitermitis]|uniref:Sulfur carrier protein FdhD n=1 Tax=Paenibacillus nasutitermitis TaxID=1652958 RepID=A0A916ZD93_9BACL|nr:formate dehydrogenase accessory sulfurtransferase FdhD [Paenibacillus nasutitermitis]GGD90090.1 sulfurtransferase FdhD [Paenibacillus nasutitermitis]